jgi:hypothetical protein
MSTNVVSFDACVLFTVLTAGFIISMYLAGRVAGRRGRSVKNWVGVAAMIGPLALPLVFLFPNLHGKNGDHGQGPNGEKRHAPGTVRRWLR